MRLTMEREKEIRNVYNTFPTIYAEKRMDTRKPPELVDMKPYIKELLSEVEALRAELKKAEKGSETSTEMWSKASTERDKLKEALKVAKDGLAGAWTAYDEERVPLSIIDDALAKINELEK